MKGQSRRGVCSCVWLKADHSPDWALLSPVLVLPPRRPPNAMNIHRCNERERGWGWRASITVICVSNKNKHANEPLSHVSCRQVLFKCQTLRERRAPLYSGRVTSGQGCQQKTQDPRNLSHLAKNPPREELEMVVQWFSPKVASSSLAPPQAVILLMTQTIFRSFGLSEVSVHRPRLEAPWAGLPSQNPARKPGVLWYAGGKLDAGSKGRTEGVSGLQAKKASKRGHRRRQTPGF